MHSLVIRSPLPLGYFDGGDYAKDCKTLRDPSHELPESLRFCEDTTFWEMRDSDSEVVQRVVIAACDPNRLEWNTVMGPLNDPNPRGSLWLYVPPSASSGGSKPLVHSHHPSGKAQRMALVGYPEGHDFHPLGTSIWPSVGGAKSNMYVVNHARARTVIEQFVVDPAKPLEAVYVRTISSWRFLSPNALALTSPDSFYVTNDHLFTRRLPVVGKVLPLVETILGLPFGFVLHVDLHPHDSPEAKEKGKDISHAFVAKYFIPFANGVALSHSGKEVAIVATSAGKVYVYARNPETDVLYKERTVVRLPFSPDNIHYTSSLADPSKEELIVGGHPNFIDLIGVVARKPGAAAGSWIVAVQFKDAENRGRKAQQTEFDLEAPASTSTKLKKDGKTWTLRTIFQSNGDEEHGGFGSSATGIRDPATGDVYVAGLYAGDGVVACRRKAV